MQNLILPLLNLPNVCLSLLSNDEALEVRAHVIVQRQAGGGLRVTRRAREPALSVHPQVLGQHVQSDEGLVADVARLVQGDDGGQRLQGGPSGHGELFVDI